MLNEFALKSESHRLATATLAVLNTEDGEIQLASAGHPAPVIADGAAKAAPLDLITGPLLGAYRHTYEVVQTTLTPGARLVFYTDGLVDVGRPGADQQLSQLVHSIENHRSGPSHRGR